MPLPYLIRGGSIFLKQIFISSISQIDDPVRIQDGSDLLGIQRGLLFTDQKIRKISIPSSFHSELGRTGQMQRKE